MKVKTPEPYNFVVVKLCDNDFTWSIIRALEDNKDLYKQLCPITWKHLIVNHCVAHCIINHNDYPIQWDKHQHTEKYLSEKISVTFEVKEPESDYNDGNVYLNIHSGKAYTF